MFKTKESVVPFNTSVKRFENSSSQIESKQAIKFEETKVSKLETNYPQNFGFGSTEKRSLSLN